MKRRTQIILGAIGTAFLLSLLPLRSVSGNEMAPTIEDGDLIWILPGAEIRRGDVVVLTDPLDPDRSVLRRAIAPGGTRVHFTEDGIRVDSKRLRIKDMGKRDGYGVYQETLWSKPPAKAVEWLTRRHREPAVRWEAEPIDVPEGHWYLLADDRDYALDSRWWGPVAVSEIQGVARLRYGPAHTWRSQLEVLKGTE